MISLKPLAGALLALTLAVPPCLAASDTAERLLANGMRVIVKPDRRAPVTVALVWYKVGAIDEVNGTTGVAHVLEHMMFKGTSSQQPGEYSRLIAAAGGRENAFTGHDYTAYFATLHKSQLELALRLEADRMVNLTLLPAEFAKEIKVVMEERRLRTEDRPRSLTYEQLMASALTAHPYRNPVIGWMNDLENMRVEDARDFYRRWYAPNNAVAVVVGDVVPEDVFALVEKHFGAIPARELPPRKPQDEPPQLGVRRVTVKAPAELPYMVMTFRVPPLRDAGADWEPYALEMLAAVLDGGQAARLPRTLVREERVASSAGAGYDGIARGPGFFYLEATPTPGRGVAEVEQALRREMKKIIDDGVTADELERVRAQAVASHVYQRDSMFFQARQIGVMELSGIPHGTIDLQLAKLREVTPEQVREVARKYFQDDALTIATLDPQPMSGRRPATRPVGLRHAE
ncbi:MAG: peptidase M16 [Betaproteobacteria bacterium RIFCSPLOWO2_02_FULL_67_26]|nr:MAG: peptidase M16 [Betaproteobacteria bacterium RIFCSPLOWO2_02_FULL_67_26]